MHRPRIPDEIAALVRGLHPALKRKVGASLQAILDEPGYGKALREELAGLRNLRVSRLRIVYRVAQKEVIEIIAIGPRERIYEETFRIIRKERAKSKSD
jgi:mRNA interferase RelE/StbE